MRLPLFYALLVMLLFTTCDQEGTKIPSPTSDTTLFALLTSDDDNNTISGKEEEGKEACFELIYPLTITLPDGTVISGNETNLWSSVKEWYEAHPESKEKPNLHYPIDILWKGETVKTINDKEEMGIAKKYCEEEKDCFYLVYPITWTMPDGTVINTTKEDWDAFKAWYEANPDTEEKPNLNYPVEIEFEDGTSQTVADESEMRSLKEDCE